MKKKSGFLAIITLALILPVALIIIMAMSGEGRYNAPPRPEGPCDIYAAAGTPCVAAHSSTRALYASYNGPLYQVRRQSDGKTLDIGLVRPGDGDTGGYANAAAQDAFCANTNCLITTLYDQSGNGNHLKQPPPGTFRGPAKGGFNTLPIADMAPITIMGYKAYGVYIIPGMGLRNNDATGPAINDEPQGVYMVFDGTHFDSGCCFNYGNTSTNSRAVGRGTMETVYFGTATAWGSGSGTGPWIMSDMEAGLFSGYNTKQNIANPTIDSWRFVTGVVNGGGGNQWEIRGGNAQEAGLTTFYSGKRPGSLENNYYYPMHRKGAIQMGNGGDNGNGSAGTFYEGVITKGYPADASINAVQANIVAARYDVPRVTLSRITSFTPGSTQNVTKTFTNTTGAPVTGVTLSLSVPRGWKSVVLNSKETSKIFTGPVAPGASVSETFSVTSPATTGSAFLTGKAGWKNQMTGLQSETVTRMVRNAFPIKINEIRFDAGNNPTNQFIELYNAGDRDVDLSNWTLINTQSEWAPVRLGTIPSGTKLSAHGFYLLGLSTSGLVAPAIRGEKIINVRSITGFGAGHQIDIDGEKRTIITVGTAAAPMTTVFVPVSTGPWLTIPAGTTNLPVTNATGFEVGQKIGIDIGGNYEVATVTAVGKAATQTTLAVAAKAGDTIIKVAANNNMTVGDTLTISTGARKELVKVKRIINVAVAPSRGGFEQGGQGESSPGSVELTAQLKFDHMLDVDVSGLGTGISYSPATSFAHKSGDAVQALGSGIMLESALDKNHEYGAFVFNAKVTSMGYEGSVSPNQWYGGPLSAAAGSVALMDASGMVVVDAMVYGSQQSNSSANGTIASPELAILEGDQSQGGCIVVVPGSGRNFGPVAPITGKPNRSVGRFPDGADTDNNCRDFLLQNAITLLAATPTGSNNIKVTSVSGFSVGQKIIIDTGTKSETTTITTIGTAGATTVVTATTEGATVIPVAGTAGFISGQPITIDSDSNNETAIVASVTTARGRFGNPGSSPGNSITVTAPLTRAHAMGVQVSGSGISITPALTMAHDNGTHVVSNLPTPGAPNQYTVSAQVKQDQNPVIFADVPDMSIVRVGDSYYMSSTTMHMSPGTPIMKSKDLVNWQLTNYAYNTLGDVDALTLSNGKNAYGKGTWASCIRYHNGTFYVSTFSSTTGKTYIFSTKDIDKGPWKEISFSPSFHDHTLFFDDDGRVYLIYGNKKLTLIELNADLSGVKTGGINQVIIENSSSPSGPDSGLGEGSQLFKVNGRLYLFNITWPKGGMRTVVVHRADKITGPWEGKLVFQDLGVAQGGIVDTPEGNWYAYLFRDFGSVGRIPYIVPVKWEDGWPVIGVDGKVPEILNLPANKGLIPGIVASDEFSRRKGESALPLVWQWNHNPDNKLWSVTDRKGYLRITTGRIDTILVSARNTLTQRTIGPVCSGSTCIDASNMKDGDFAGLALLQRKFGQVGVMFRNGTKSIVMVNAQSGKPIEVQSVPLTQKTIFLKAECDFREKADIANFFYSLDGKKWMPIGSQLKMEYSMPHFMGYRYGLFNYATKTPGGFVDFDFFHISGQIPEKN